MNEVGLIGLGVMGKSFALNIANNNNSISVFNRGSKVTDDFLNNEALNKSITGYYSLEDFVSSLKKPRKIILMVAAGNPVDYVIDGILPYLEKGDLVIDGGNSHFPDTIKRQKYLEGKEIEFLGMGVSGGEEGALKGPSIMTGGKKDAYKLVEELLKSVSADSKYGKCSLLMGNDGAGHFVKMIHNGIEYAMMQAISEVYHILKKVLNLSNKEISKVFEKWNEGDLNSYLMEISYKILIKKDDKSSENLVDMILDKAGQKGTGRWTIENALDVGIPTPSLNLSVIARNISYFKEERVEISSKIKKDNVKNEINKKEFIDKLEDSLLFTNILIFSQGIWLISETSSHYNFNIDLIDVLKVWGNGCIIKARLLDYYIGILEKDIHNVNFLNSVSVLNKLESKVLSVNSVLSVSRINYIPTLVINSALDYFFSMIENRLPANLIQAQRDFFGAHTYKRVDEEGDFHTIWE